MAALRFLLITQSAFWPPWFAGDRTKVARLVDYLRSKGHAVDVAHLHDASEVGADYDGMRARCDRLALYYPTPADLEARTTGVMDDWAPPGFLAMIDAFGREARPDVVIAQCVFNSKCLDLFRHTTTVRVLDADNIFDGRAELFRAGGVEYSWFTTDARQERDGLRRAQIILAIQENEAAHFRRIVPDREVVLLPHAMEVAYHAPAADRNLLFVGAANRENILGVSRFIRESLPVLRVSFPDVTLQVAGLSSLAIPSADGVTPLGVVPDLGAAYDATQIVLNTTPVGTGIKIKTVDALCHGKCLVSTEAGVQGLERYPEIYHVARSSDAFTSTVARLLANPELIRQTEQRARAFAADYFHPDVVYGRLLQAVQQRLVA